MSRIVVVLALLTLLALPATTVGAAEATLDRPGFTCSGGSATVRFSWRPASGASVQYIDVSLAGDGFAPGTFTSAGPFDAGVSSYTWPAMRANVRHYYRVNALTPAGWQSTADTFTAPCHPAEASTGGRDAPFSLYAGVYVLDLGSGAVKRLADTRGHTDFFPNDRTFDWSPDGSRVAVVLGANNGLRVYDTAGVLQSEVKGQAYSVDWLDGNTVGVHVRRGGFEGEEGDALVNAATGAIERFVPYPAGGLWSPDGRSVLVLHHEQGQTKRSLFVRDVATGDDRFLRTAEFSRIYWSPDGTRVAASISEGPQAAVIVLDAATGSEQSRFGILTNEVAWSPGGRSLAVSGYSNEAMYLSVLPLDGSPPRIVAKGTQASWSPDGASLSYIRDGALWVTTLGDGVETPLLRPQLPVIREQRWSPAANMVAFRVSGAGGVHVMRADGSEERYLAPGFSPRWSPKGDRLGFVYGEGNLGFGGAVYTMTPRATAINRLGSVFSGDAISPCWGGDRFDWSPDGTSIAYWTQTDRGTELLTAGDAAGATPRRLAMGSSPAWAPDGMRLAFTGPGSAAGTPPAETQSVCKVSTADRDGANTVVLAEGARVPAWSPDGSSVAVEAMIAGIGDRLRIIAADGGGTRVELRGRSAKWSPDGKRLALIRPNTPAGAIVPPHSQMQLVVVNANGPSEKVLATNSIGSYAWSPDGTRIAYGVSTPMETGIYVVDLETGISKLIGNGSGPSWSPDGEWIAFTRY